MKRLEVYKPITTDIRGAMQLFGFGKNRMTDIANKAGAVIVINSRCKRYNVQKIEDYLNKQGNDTEG